MRKFVLAAAAVTTVLALSACKKGEEAAPAATETAATEAAPADTAAATDAAATEAAPAATSEAPKM